MQFTTDQHPNSPPALCPKHGVFPVTSIYIENGSGMFSGNITSCPNCNARSPIIDGTYSFARKAMHLLTHPSVTPEQLKALQAILTQVQSGEIDREQATVLAAGLPQFMQKLLGSIDLTNAAISALMGFALSQCSQSAPTVSVTNNYNYNYSISAPIKPNETTAKDTHPPRKKVPAPRLKPKPK